MLGEEATFKLRRVGQTYYSVLWDVMDGNVQWTPEGGETKSYIGNSGKSVDVPTKVQFFTTKIPLWLNTNDIEVMRSCFGEPTTTSSGSIYTYTFDLSKISQQVDFVMTGSRYGGSGEGIDFTGSASSIRFENLNIEKQGLFKWECSLKVPAQNFTWAVKSTQNLA